DRTRAAGGRAALALPDGRARGVGSRRRRAELLLRAREPQGPGRPLRGGAGARARDGRRNRRGNPGAPLRAEAVLRALLVLRLPDRLSRRREVGGSTRRLGPGPNARNLRQKLPRSQTRA